MTRIISLMQNKGGASKTTICFNLAKNYLRNGRKVITIDLDQQQDIKNMLPTSTFKIPLAEIPNLDCDYVVVDTGPRFEQSHIELMEISSVIVIPTPLERLDIDATTRLLKTAKSLNVLDKVKILPIQAKKRTQIFKALYPFIEQLADSYNVEILSSISDSTYVSKANLENKTVFEIKSSPEIRKEFKTLFNEVGKCLQI